MHALDHFSGLVQLVGQLLLDCCACCEALCARPGAIFRATSTDGRAALPITALVGFLIGVVLAYLMACSCASSGPSPSSSTSWASR
jgi:phospholipid/cholesterol/gamma-HCH transport system permease protein